MLFWIILVALALLAGLWVARPFLRRSAMEMEATDSTISIYRDQIDEIERDRTAGLISDAECDAARQEIERRALAAARRLDQGFFVGHRSVPAALTLITACAGAVVVVYAMLGSPGTPDQPLAARRSEMLTQQAAAGDINASIQLLADASKETPEDFETWWLLAKSYAAAGDTASAADAFRHAAELSDDNPAVHTAYAEAMTLANGNKVPAAARVIFEQVLQTGPDPRARYYVSLAKAQAQDFEGAVEGWAALAADSDPQAPWLAMVRRDIVNMSRFLKHDVTRHLPDATPEEIAAAGGTAQVRETLVDTASLEAAVDADPTDHAAWILLARTHAMTGNAKAALDALQRGRAGFRTAPYVLSKFDATARELGLDMLDDGRDRMGAPSGPTPEDIATASQLSKSEQDDMIDGMVAGLAAKLVDNPDNPDGWIMLVRSYASLGKMDAAREAYVAALTHYDSDAEVVAHIRNNTAQIIGEN